MIPNQTLISFPEFSTTGTKTAPAPVKYAAGFQAADVLPAEWMNYFINKSSAGITAINSGLASVEAELNNIVTAAGETPSAATSNQVITAINSLRTAVTGALDNLTTTAKNTLVAAINELVSKVGDLTTLNTTVKTSLVAAINDIKSLFGSAADLNAGSAPGSIPVIGGATYLTFGSKIPLVTTTDGKITLDAHYSSLRDAAFKSVATLLNPTGTDLTPAKVITPHVFYTVNEEIMQGSNSTKHTYTFDTPVYLTKGTVIKIWFQNACRNNSSTKPTNTSYYPCLKVNNIEYPIYKDPSTLLAPVHAASSYWYWWQNNTFLELMFDENKFIIMGNPVVMSYKSNASGYRVYADGYIEQWGTYTGRGVNNITFPISHSYTPHLSFCGNININNSAIWASLGYNVDTNGFTVNWNADNTFLWSVHGY